MAAFKMESAECVYAFSYVSYSYSLALLCSLLAFLNGSKYCTCVVVLVLDFESNKICIFAFGLRNACTAQQHMQARGYVLR